MCFFLKLYLVRLCQRCTRLTLSDLIKQSDLQTFSWNRTRLLVGTYCTSPLPPHPLGPGAHVVVAILSMALHAGLAALAASTSAPLPNVTSPSQNILSDHRVLAFPLPLIPTRTKSSQRKRGANLTAGLQKARQTTIPSQGSLPQLSG